MPAAKKGSKAATAAKANAQGARTTQKKNVRHSVHFFRPKTLRIARKPKYARTAVPSQKGLDAHSIIRFPLTSEAAMKKIENNNTLVFIVDIRASKPQIKQAVKTLYSIEAEKVNTLIRPDGQKKAYVRLTSDYDALDVADNVHLI
jgi:large subunit ribosomal protein L23Ae